MRHDLTLEGNAYRLRPVAEQDAAFIVALRTDPALNRHLHHTSANINDQLAWLESYYQRQNDYYFVVERRHARSPEGLISIYDIDPGKASAEWGRWILLPGSPGAVESACLIYRCAFEILGLVEVYCRTLRNNATVVSFHDSCGIPSRRLLVGHFEIAGERLDAIEHRLDRETWIATVRPRLEKLAELTARKIRHA